ncbi:cyclohexanecarboxylate-CoA ligase [Sphingopyxis lindanitolerans]|uniref:Cyclohexanecarboxylate-CoA ligase n=1 Tax=Sphingopyxis lindanitolerans TaxID=2054227 RepID=A0A2S8B5R1_9SPHN|nr:AMP-binding protein [Sphingopyxis lindanitolerans]PQM27751.1 cyclohexanecarboxylate-CoA ligase [Sphingopyxis lindanitolerans]
MIVTQEDAIAARDIPADLLATWSAEGFHHARSLAETMARAAHDHGDAEFHVLAEHRPTIDSLAAIHRAGLKLAGSLERLGVARGDVIAMQMSNCAENAIIFQAAAALGCPILPIVHILGPAELSFILNDSGARIFFTPDHWKAIDFLDRVRRIDPRPPAMQHIVVGDTAPPGSLLWRNLPSGPLTPRSVAADETALLLYTSGTTGRPKGVCHSARTIHGELAAQSRHRAEGGTWLGPWPSGHIAGTLSILGHALLGRTTVVMESWDAAVAAEQIERHAIEQTSGTPFHLSGLLEAATRDGRSLASLRQYVIGATTVPATLVAQAEAAGIRCCRCYGSTEMPSITQCEPEDPLERRLTTDGRPTPGAEVRIVDDGGRDVPTGTAGEVAVRGPERFTGYLRVEDNDDAFLPGGWFLTGDIGVLDGENYLAITDRKKDIIIRGGENIASREVEDLLLAVDGIAEVAVVGWPDPRLGEKICAVIVARDGATPPSIATIAAAFQKIGIARQKTPEHVVLVEALPRNASGKVLKAELRRSLRGDGPLA